MGNSVTEGIIRRRRKNFILSSGLLSSIDFRPSVHAVARVNNMTEKMLRILDLPAGPGEEEVQSTIPTFQSAINFMADSGGLLGVGSRRSRDYERRPGASP